ncbi:MAG: DMT family transporter [Alkalinema sp. RU_4_3]|nr:DMT family transporter [Alkalinema sp. RU_4_3]
MRRSFSKIPAQLYLWLGVLIFGASSSVTRKLTQIGAQQAINGHNPISLCNVLFVGNLCALGVMILLYRRQLNWRDIKKITRSQWGSLMIVTLCAGALGPAAVFHALSVTPVNTIILLGRLELPLDLIASKLILKENVTRHQTMGAIVVAIGVLITVLGNRPASALVSLGTGELLTIGSAVLFSTSKIIGKRNLLTVPPGIVMTFRTGLGSVIFFFVALKLYGAGHFAEVLSPFLWRWMLVYGAIIVVVGQFFWTKGFRETPLAVSTLVSCFSPIVSMVCAYWILAEAPTAAQTLGGLILLMGLLISQYRHSANSIEIAKAPQ